MERSLYNRYIWLIFFLNVMTSLRAVSCLSRHHNVAQSGTWAFSGSTMAKKAIMENPLTSPLVLRRASLKWYKWDGRRDGGREVYLFCYQEVITQSFSCADGPQEEDKDQIQEPPVDHQ